LKQEIVSVKKGYGIFGKPYEIMLKNDLHDPVSIDHALMRDMVLLDEESFQALYQKPVRRNLEKHELYAFARQFKAASDRQSIRNVLEYTSDIAMRYDMDFKDMLFGGTEKQILERGTDWCADMARVGAVLLQCLGIPCRILHLVNLDKAYHGHVVGEAYYEGGYGVVDFIYGYQFYDETPVSACNIMRSPDALNACPDTYRGLYSAIGVSEYDPMDANNDYSISIPNEYYMKLIYTDHQDAWIMGEDRDL